MKIYNSLSREIEEINTIHDNEIRIYACGPTVYNFFHLGNARPLIVFDTLRRYLEYRGYKVKFVQNFTDIDDKVIIRANEEELSIEEISTRYIKEYFYDADNLNVRRATVHPKATEHIREMIKLVQILMDKNYAYVANDGVYYDVNKFADYLKLSHFNKDELIDNVRKEANAEAGKRSAADFVLWKFRKGNEPYWDSPWGEGRPGWHLECSAMSQKYLGETFDIHAGGKDLIFPHHENEIAQSEAATGKPFANYWMHNGFINIDNEKMSKSKGNFFLIREIAEKHGYMPIRLFVLNSHYRTPINYSIEFIEGAKSAYKRIKTLYKNLDFLLDKADREENLEKPVSPAMYDNVLKNDRSERVFSCIELTKTKFVETMDNDLNTAEALAAIFDFVKEMNIELQGGLPIHVIKEIFACLLELTDVLGLSFEEEEAIPQEVLDFVELRTAAKKNKDYALADEYRDKILALGYRVLDTPHGSKIEVNE